MNLIRDRLDGNLPLADHARDCGLSPSHFACAFRCSFGMPGHRYLVAQRIDVAKTLLLHTNQSGLQIALESGFEDQATFSRAFRRMVGTSPSDWKRQCRSGPVSLYWSALKLRKLNCLTSEPRLNPGDTSFRSPRLELPRSPFPGLTRVDPQGADHPESRSSQ